MLREGKRIRLLETMIDRYDDGRSRSFYCRAAALLDPEALEHSLDEAKRATAGRRTSTADRAKVLRGILAEVALAERIELARTLTGRGA